MAGGAPGGGAGGYGVAREVSFAFWAGAAFFPTVLEEPVFWWDVGDVGAGSEAVDGGVLVFFSDVFEGTEGDEADFFSEGGWVELGGGDAGVEAEAPTDFIGHPVADAGAGFLVEEEGFEGLFGVAFDEFSDAGEGEFGILGLWREVGPGVGAVVEHDAAEHAVIVENEGGFGGAEDEMVVFVDFVIGGSGRELAGHAEVDFKVKLWGEGEEHAFAVGFGGEEFFSFKNAEGGGGAVAVDAGLGVDFDGDDGFSLGGGPLAAGEFDFSEFWHGVTIGASGNFEIGIWHGMR
ncbi:MAG: hypothetical protein ACI9NQ_001596 [Paracoccaceae bacterium]